MKSGTAAKSHRSTWFGALVDLLTTYGETAGNFLVYSSAYLAFLAMVYVAIAMVLLSVSPNLAPVVMGLVVFAVYANDRLIDVEADATIDPERASFVRRHEKELKALAALAYGTAVALSVLGGPMTLSVTLLPGVFWILYATEWIPDIGIHVRRLKEVLFVNSAVVGFAWAVSATLLPIGFANATLTTSSGVVFAYFFLRSFTNTEIPNVRDVNADRIMGVATIPVVYGIDSTRRILYGIDLFTMALVVYAAVGGYLPTPPATALLVGLVYSLVVTSFIGRVDNASLLALAAEHEYVVVGLVLIPTVYGI